MRCCFALRRPALASQPKKVKPTQMKHLLIFFAAVFIFNDFSLAESAPKAPTEAEMKKICEQHFPSLLQGPTRQACVTGAQQLTTNGAKRADLHCRLTFGFAASTTMACLIGAEIAAEVTKGEDVFRARWTACNEHFPSHTEVDSYLQESCLIGYYLPDWSTSGGDDLCAGLSNERTFLGPCRVGVRLFRDKKDGSTTFSKDLNQSCEKYFDHSVFHTGYRSCLNAKGLGLGQTPSAREILKSCAGLTTNADPESEKAACVVGVSLLRNLRQSGKASERFAGCGTSKVTYEDRDVLACLTAASLLDFSEKKEAEGVCKEVFSGKKSRSRGDCTKALSASFKETTVTE